MRAADHGGGHQDAATGLRLLSAPTAVTYRIARSSRGPFDPPRREGRPDGSWSRYDTVGQTVYLAETVEGAYAEVLAYAKRRLGRRDPLAADAAAAGLSLATFVELVGQEWAERQHMAVGHLPASWRVERLLYHCTLPPAGWWVEIEHPDSLAAVETALEDKLAELGLPALTTGVLRGEDRRATAVVARWVRAQHLDDGSTPAGIAYRSKHGTGRCWAYWLPNKPPRDQTPTRDDGSPILADDENLLRVAARFHVQVW